jgi:hypothetical protein
MPTASDDITQRQLTVRLPESALKVARRTAKARGLSVNALVRSLLVAMQRDDEEPCTSSWAVMTTRASSTPPPRRRA